MPSVKGIPLQKAVQPGPPSALPLYKVLQPRFPLSLSDSFVQWKTRYDLQAAETAVLDCVGLNPAKPNGNFIVKSLNIPVNIPCGCAQKKTGSVSMNELEVRPSATSSSGDSHTVLVHGYGASKGFFYRNLKSLAVSSNSTLHALDWLGYGRSSRVLPKLPRFSNRKEGVLYAESFFLTAFESWRKHRNIEKFTLVAHSLGAYLACVYASTFPDRVEKIVLVSPASVNRTGCAIPVKELDPSCDASPLIGPSPEPPSWFRWMWERHWSPFALVRYTGPLGPKIASGWASRRFAELPKQDQEALQNYAYTMFNSPGSGEYLLNYFLACGGVGRWPLVERLSGIRCPTLWLYGDRDWMPSDGGKEAVRRLQNMGLHAQLRIVPESGHHLYLDNSDDFHKMVSGFLGSHIS